MESQAPTTARDILATWSAVLVLLLLANLVAGDLLALGFSTFEAGSGPAPDDTVPAKAPGEFRVLCLGDSVTRGVGVALKDTWPFMAQELAQAWSPRPLRFVNRGVAGYSTFEGMAWLEQEGLDLEPDLVLVANNHNDYSQAQVPDREWLGRSPAGRRLRWSLRNLPLVLLVQRLVPPAYRRPGYPDQARAGFRVPLQDRAEALDRIRQVCATRGIQTGLVLLPQALQPWPSNRYVADLRNYSRRNGVVLADALLAAQESESWSSFFPEGDTIHLTATGQELTARTVARLLWDQQLIPPR